MKCFIAMMGLLLSFSFQTVEAATVSADPLFAKHLKGSIWQKSESSGLDDYYTRHSTIRMEFFNQFSDATHPTVHLTVNSTSNDYDAPDMDEDIYYYSSVSVWGDGKQIDVSAGSAGDFTLILNPQRGDCLLVKGQSYPSDCMTRRRY